MDATALALIAELGKKTGVCWIAVGDRQQAIWHAWHDDALLFVSGGDEQPFPEVADGTTVTVTMRSKDTGGRLLDWEGVVSRVLPDSPSWDSAVAALAAERLNLPSVTETPLSWASTSVILRVDPVSR